ncbi:hypothetical protein ABGF49_07305 [Helcococcus ovis]|uniref:hypothetical protein n=1 Tax=Helcococcus TaxID=31983 RepID=UPI0038B72071
MKKIKELKNEILFNEKIKEAEFEKLSKAKEEVAKIEDKIANLDYKKEELQKQISNIEELKKQGIDVENLEDKNKLLNELILDKIKNGTDDKTYLNVIDEWIIDKIYSTDDIVKKNDKIYYANKDHKSDYENIPGINDEFWREKVIPEIIKKGENEEYVKNIKTAKNWYAEETYQVNDYVIYYNKLYKATEKISNGKIPEEYDKWILIPKVK